MVWVYGLVPVVLLNEPTRAKTAIYALTCNTYASGAIRQGMEAALMTLTTLIFVAVMLVLTRKG
jgi:hypothetical protein